MLHLQIKVCEINNRKISWCDICWADWSDTVRYVIRGFRRGRGVGGRGDLPKQIQILMLRKKIITTIGFGLPMQSYSTCTLKDFTKCLIYNIPKNSKKNN